MLPLVSYKSAVGSCLPAGAIEIGDLICSTDDDALHSSGWRHGDRSPLVGEKNTGENLFVTSSAFDNDSILC